MFLQILYSEIILVYVHKYLIAQFVFIIQDRVMTPTGLVLAILRLADDIIFLYIFSSLKLILLLVVILYTT